MAPKSKNLYFMITETPASHGSIRAGQICYINEDRYSQPKRLKRDTLPVILIGSTLDRDLPFEVLEPLTQQQAEFLLALDTHKERLEEFTQSKNLGQAEVLVKGSEVRVEYNGEWLKGVVRYIGRLREPIIDPIGGVFFGVELQGEDKGRGRNDGTYQFKTYFTCQKNCGIFAPFNRINPVHTKPSGFSHATQSGLPESAEKFSVGDRVVYFIGSERRHGMVVELDEEKSMVLISTERDENGRDGGETIVSLKYVFKEDDLNKDETEKMDTSESPEIVKSLGGNADISMNSMVEVDLGKGPAYGTVRWIGHLPGKPELMAGLELEEDCGVNDGTFKNHRFFTCPPKRGLFVKITSCRPDARFLGDKASNGHFDHDGLGGSAMQDSVPPVRSEDVLKVLTGRMKGIQGHCNSCYMDSALFSLFSCSSVLDSLLFKGTKQNEESIQRTLRRDIVCPLRSEGFVANHSVMKLRQQLQDRGHSPSYTTDEKDPEEFLTLIMQDILSLEPPLKLQTFGGKVESSYFYQIFVDYNTSLVLPTVQQLLEHSFYNSGLRLAEVPSCLILTMPRSGKKFKMFSKIIPSLELDITALLSNGPQQCVLCGQLANVECTECFGDPVFSNTGFKLFCDTCSAQVHLHPCRQSHKPTALGLPEGFFHRRGSDGPAHVPREKLELFAVLCIETSHYVSFIKHGPKAADWIFFDSMADRMGDQDGYNVPQVKECPEVVRYLTMPLTELAAQVPREMEGVAKRLFCDGYMYMYQSPSMALYR
ncbi:ubiquitin carboxyl-terminal hydrolase CYLD [Colossoma macropomum]|uniref:ubiquitin carboxyl-terminal hydrolase CYLD n=1 Tax=Colossoma macropomum TaxID=42526 RepID=UPI00186542B6|nr:ubiquitin carboxyl-terminal hydrolase CYLD [Colossoma macropomum]XP_036417692.1 ubiquitin carboxyl-terminal hydrolase CYLD [Colossoma macropomum]